MNLSGRVGDYIRREALLEPGQDVVVGVSGGPDSLCLLDCLNQLEYRPIVAHFDHRLRADSAQDAEFVREVARSYRLPYHLGRGDVIEAGGGIEQAARQLRYRHLIRVAEQTHVTAVAVGHTAADQAETVLMHLLRGAGSAGLRGMGASTGLNVITNLDAAEGRRLIRPLLEVAREDTLAHCRTVGLEPRTDPTNSDPRFFRNRLRNELMPVLRSYNPRIQETLVRTAKVMAAEAEAIEAMVDSNWARWVAEPGKGALALCYEKMRGAPVAVQRATVRRAIFQLKPGMRDLGFDSVERAIESMAAGRRLSLTGGLELVPMGGETILKFQGEPVPIMGMPQLSTTRPVNLEIPFSLELAQSWVLSGERVQDAGAGAEGRTEAWFDEEILAGDLTVGGPRPGDRFTPLGMTGSVKLSDLFANRKIPRPARERWPVISNNSEILWVVGLHRSRTAQISPDTHKAVHFRVLNESDLKLEKP